MAQEIRCTVSNCGFWGNGDVCEAEKIEVAVTGSAGARMDAGRMVGAGRRAATSEETCCVTFKPKD